MWDIPAQRGARHRPVLSPGLTETCRDCGQRSLDYLGELKDKQTLGRAELGDVRRALRGVLGLAQVDNGELVFTLKKKKKEMWLFLLPRAEIGDAGLESALWGGLSW